MLLFHLRLLFVVGHNFMHFVDLCMHRNYRINNTKQFQLILVRE